jgi:hypothetical protein
MSFENHESDRARVPGGETRKQAAGVSVPPQIVAKQADSPAHRSGYRSRDRLQSPVRVPAQSTWIVWPPFCSVCM